MLTWAQYELHHVDLGDQRLNKRLPALVADLAEHPTASVPQATGDWASTKAAYRFWDNDRVCPTAIRAAHRLRTLERLPDRGPVLALQDTTSLDFTLHPATRGLGYLSHPRHLGLWVHSVLCASSDGVPLGIRHQEVWTRSLLTLGKRAQPRHKATSAKESARWLRALHGTAQALPADRTVIAVADREADFYDLFAQPRRPNLHLLIRAKGRRRVQHAAGLLLPALPAQPVCGRLSLQVRQGKNQVARTATLAVRFSSVLLQPPSTHPRRKELSALPLNAVLVEEEQPPPGQKPVRWLLLTTLPGTSYEEAVQVVRWYARRWLTEINQADYRSSGSLDLGGVAA